MRQFPYQNFSTPRVPERSTFHSRGYATIFRLFAYLEPTITNTTYSCMYVYVYNAMPTYIHTYIHTYVRTCVRAYVYMYIHLKLYTYIYNSIYISIYICACTCIYIQVCLYIYIYIYVYLLIRRTARFSPPTADIQHETSAVRTSWGSADLREASSRFRIALGAEKLAASRPACTSFGPQDVKTGCCFAKSHIR